MYSNASYKLTKMPKTGDSPQDLGKTPTKTALFHTPQKPPRNITQINNHKTVPPTVKTQKPLTRKSSVPPLTHTPRTPEEPPSSQGYNRFSHSDSSSPSPSSISNGMSSSNVSSASSTPIAEPILPSIQPETIFADLKKEIKMAQNNFDETISTSNIKYLEAKANLNLLLDEYHGEIHLTLEQDVNLLGRKAAGEKYNVMYDNAKKECDEKIKALEKLHKQEISTAITTCAAAIARITNEGRKELLNTNIADKHGAYMLSAKVIFNAHSEKMKKTALELH